MPTATTWCPRTTPHYPALLRTTDSAAERSLLAAVAPGGVLLVVHPADMDLQHAGAHGLDPADYIRPCDVATLPDWQVEVDARRAREVTAGAGAHHTHDVVLRARRLR